MWVAAFLAVLAPDATAQEGSVFDAPDELWVVGDIRVPPVADTFALMEVHRWPQRSLGFTLIYATPLVRGIDMNVYVYPLSPERRALGAEASVEAEFASALEGLRQYTADNRPGTSVTVDEEGPCTVPGEPGEVVEGRCARGTFTRSGDTLRTLLWVFRKGDRYLKYRVSHRVEDAERLAPRLEAWLRETWAGIGEGVEGAEPSR